MWRSLILSVMLCSTSFASEPTFDSIDYSSPAQYLAIPASLGNPTAIKTQALGLKANRDRKTILNILNWMEANLKYKADLAYQWRNYDTVVEEGCYGGCADQGIVCGVLLKSAGIPAVWVKTMDVPWIWDLKKGRRFQSWSGHVFLEIYIDQKWVLLDPGAKMIYVDYSPKTRILPGNRFAYHKGNDPKKMIMSLQWEAWKQQTETYFSKLDESLLPIDSATAVSLVPKCFIIGNSPYYQIMTTLAQKKKQTVAKSFNNDYDRYLPQAKGHIILIETHKGVPIIPIAKLETHFPKASQGLKTGSIMIGDTKLVFVDFEKLLIPDAEKKKPLKETKSQVIN